MYIIISYILLERNLIVGHDTRESSGCYNTKLVVVVVVNRDDRVNIGKRWQ